MSIQVRIINGASAAYACIMHDGGSLDMRLSPGRSAANSLRESAADAMREAARLTRRAMVCREAADMLDGNGAARTLPDSEALRLIHAALDAREWNSDTLESIAAVLNESGRIVRDVTEGE